MHSLIVQDGRLASYAEMATEIADVGALVSIERARLSVYELKSKLLGMIVQKHDVRSTTLLISSDYIELRGAIVNALRPFPDAARAVGSALHSLETKAAQTITESKRPVMIEAQAVAS